MSTLVFCPSCGGILAGSADEMVGGRKCSCSGTGVAVAEKTGVGIAGLPSSSGAGLSSSSSGLPSSASGLASSSSTQSRKICVQCSKDVTSAKRMKDSKGKYWCIECGKADQAKKGVSSSSSSSSSGSVCPDCLQSFPPVQLIKHGNKYICQGCLTISIRREKEKAGTLLGRLKGSLTGGGDSGAGDGKRNRMLLLVLVVLALIAAYTYI